jgi:Asp-tRNA(Asn)/Glu-tRNA(Gln) amidotransferase A subunit family amidase
VLAPSFDTVGWFANTLDNLEKAFCELAHVESGGASPLFITLADEGVNALLDVTVRNAFSALKNTYGELHSVPALLDLEAWATAFRILQASEAWIEHGLWVLENGNQLGPDIRQRFTIAAAITPAQIKEAQAVRVAMIHEINRILDAQNKVIVIPTVPAPAPLLTAESEQVDNIRKRSQNLLCIAGLAGLPQLSMPWIKVDGAPVGLSLIGSRGCDEIVLQAARILQSQLSNASSQQVNA